MNNFKKKNNPISDNRGYSQKGPRKFSKSDNFQSREKFSASDDSSAHRTGEHPRKFNKPFRKDNDNYGKKSNPRGRANVRQRDGNRELPSKKILRNDPVRLNKVLADAGVASRRKADELILQGVVRVNGQVITTLGFKVQADDFITVHGDPIPKVDKKIYFLLNKPKDIIVSTEDERDRRTVMDLIKTNFRIFPVGRLDRNTTGALLLTNDGELSHRLLHPSYHIPRTYIALLDKELKSQDAEQISKGVELEDGMTSPCEVLIHPKNTRKVIITLFEGRNHEVKRIFMHFNYNVKQLDRKVFAGLSIQRLERGEYRLLSKKEVNLLKKMVNIDF